MNANASAFLHILAFRCPRCGKPIVEWALNPMKSLESIDGTAFQLTCSCGWTAERVGAQAREHWVHPWSTASDPSGEDADNMPRSERDTLNTV